MNSLEISYGFPNFIPFDFNHSSALLATLSSRFIFEGLQSLASLDNSGRVSGVFTVL
jgi:hypothetical protein